MSDFIREVLGNPAYSERLVISASATDRGVTDDDWGVVNIKAIDDSKTVGNDLSINELDKLIQDLQDVRSFLKS